MADEVILLDFYFSMFGMRARIALAEKSVEYEYKEENLADKSPLLLELNPVHKKIPVLVHNGKPICESLIIVEYIDEVWKDKSPLLPSCPYERAHARFWANFIDTKVDPAARKMIFSNEKEAGKSELFDAVKVLEGELGDKPYFNGEEFGFIDLAFIPFYSWFDAYETYGNFSFEQDFPKVVAWAKRCIQKESVSKSLACRNKVLEFVSAMRKMFGVE